ncbi:MAG: 6-bladed beta-propeller [Candidatus Saccharicenans sp.]|uniref:6-bladed beta-propeller n=1 Tax=Candidatus Saccharicenans sp. TaxID=2819258 RepID=UPI00404910C1
MKKTLLLSILIIWSILCALTLEKVSVAELKMISSFPNQEIFFRTFPKIDVDRGGCVHAVDNREHMVFKFSKDGDLLLKFGGWGQGPGELQWPAKIAVDKITGEIFIKDNTGIAVFDAKGNFVRWIRTFTGILNFYTGSSRIIVLESTPGKKDLVGVYHYQGKLVQSIGQKYDLDYSLSKEISPYHLDRIANDGAVFSEGELVYYVSYLFG